MAKGRILSGMRPTGRLHLGNYTGALETGSGSKGSTRTSTWWRTGTP